MRHQTATSPVRLIAMVLAATALGLASLSASAAANTFTASDAASLATAFQQADSLGGNNEIDVLPAVDSSGNPDAYHETKTLELHNGALTIKGPAPTPNVNQATTNISGLSITSPTTGSPVFMIDSHASLILKDVEVSNAGIAGTTPAIDDSGTLTVDQSSIAGNGGTGVVVEPAAAATVVNSTLSDNGDFGLTDSSTGTATLTNVTVTTNQNGGIANGGATLNLINSIVAENGPSNVTNCTKPATTQDDSLDNSSPSSCGLPMGPLSGVNPKLSAINPFGGPTPVHVPSPTTSAAIDAGDAAKCPFVDQRGAPRPNDAGTGCDVGSVETDLGPPVINTPDVHATTGQGSTGTNVTFTAVFADTTSPVDTKTISCMPKSGDFFKVGTTQVNCTAKNDFGIQGTGSFNVTVTQVTPTPPTVTTPSDQTLAAVDASGVNYTYDPPPAATDTIDGPIPVTCDPAAPGAKFPLGVTTVKCTATNSNGMSTTKTFKVTVTDQTPPVIHVPANMTVVATSSSGAVVTYTVTATDNVDGSDPVNCTPASGAPFPVGTTTVMCSAQDAAGNKATATFTVTVHNPAPVIHTPGDIRANATSAAGAVVSFSVTATSDVDGTADPVTCAPSSGTTFPLGTTRVNCHATDSQGNTGTGSFSVIVTDVTPPVITVPANISVPTTGPAGAVVNFTVTAMDAVDGTVIPACTPASGSTFPITTTTVTCTAADKSGNAAMASFTVTVTPTPPVIAIPAPITVTATVASGAAVTYTVTATDAVDGTDPVTCTPASGSTFAVGTTTVNCMATDTAGNMTNASFKVTVKAPPKPPAITVPPFTTLGATSAAGVQFTYTAKATDGVDGTDPVTCTPPSGSTFPVGMTTVTCTSTDSGGRTATATFIVQVDPPAGPSVATILSSKASAITGKVTVELECDGDNPCKFKIALEMRSAAAAKAAHFRSRVLTSRDVTMDGGGSGKTIRLSLNKAAKALLHSQGRLPVEIRITQPGSKAEIKRLTFKP